jgi:hypothetical protein
MGAAMKHDLRNYVPDVAKVLEESGPEALKERERTASVKLREAGLVERGTPEPAARTSASSPWSKDGTGGLDKAALPSAMTPATDDPAPYEVSEAAEERGATRLQESVRGRRRTRALLLGLALLAVSALFAVVVVRQKPTSKEEAPAATAAAQAASAKPAPSAAPVLIEAPTPPQPAAAPVPSTAPSASAGRASAKRPHQPRDGAAVDAGATNKPEQGDDIRIW